MTISKRARSLIGAGVVVGGACVVAGAIALSSNAASAAVASQHSAPATAAKPAAVAKAKAAVKAAVPANRLACLNAAAFIGDQGLLEFGPPTKVLHQPAPGDVTAWFKTAVVTRTATTTTCTYHDTVAGSKVPDITLTYSDESAADFTAETAAAVAAGTGQKVNPVDEHLLGYTTATNGYVLDGTYKVMIGGLDKGWRDAFTHGWWVRSS